MKIIFHTSAKIYKYIYNKIAKFSRIIFFRFIIRSNDTNEIVISSNSSRWLRNLKNFSTSSMLLVKENYGNKKRNLYSWIKHRLDCYKIIKHFKLEISENLVNYSYSEKSKKFCCCCTISNAIFLNVFRDKILFLYNS